MAQFHISGRPRPSRVSALLDPGEGPMTQAAAVAASGSRPSRLVTQVIALPQEAAARSPKIWLAAAAGGVCVIAAVIYFNPIAPEAGPVRVASTTAKKAKSSAFFTPPKPVVSGATWSSGRKGAPPRQTVPSAAALAAYRNQVERIAEKQKKTQATMR